MKKLFLKKFYIFDDFSSMCGAEKCEKSCFVGKNGKTFFFLCFFLKLFLLLHIFTNVEDETMILYFPSKQCFKMGYSKSFVHVCIFDGYLAHRRKIYAFFRTKYTKYHKNPVSPEIRTRLKSLPNW